MGEQFPQLHLAVNLRTVTGILVLTAWPDVAVAASQQIWSRCESHDAPQAISACTQILNGNESAQDRAKALWWRGLHYSGIKAYDRAIEDLTGSIEISSSDASAFNQRGFAYFYSGKYQQAIQDFTRSLELDPDFQPETTMHFRGRAYSFVGDHDRAIADLTQVIETSPDENSYYYRGQSYFKRGKLRQARDDLNKALEISPQHEAARSFLELVDAAEHMQKPGEGREASPDPKAARKPELSPDLSGGGVGDQEGLGKLE